MTVEVFALELVRLRAKWVRFGGHDLILCSNSSSLFSFSRRFRGGVYFSFLGSYTFLYLWCQLTLLGGPLLNLHGH